MRQAIQPDDIPVDEYIRGEDGADVRHEYLGGRVYAMTGASRAHGLITVNIAAALLPSARKRGCQLFASDMKVRLAIADEAIFYYPDVLISCDPADRETYFCTAPCLIVEVLSQQTERIDRREKYLAYQTLASLGAYVLVAQDRRRVELFRRETAFHAEVLTEGELPIECLQTRLSLAAIYDGVELPAGPNRT